MTYQFPNCSLIFDPVTSHKSCYAWEKIKPWQAMSLMGPILILSVGLHKGQHCWTVHYISVVDDALLFTHEILCNVSFYIFNITVHTG